MQGNKVWLTVGVPVHPKSVAWGRGQGSVQASDVPPKLTAIFKNEAVFVQVDTGKGPPLICCHKVRRTVLSDLSLHKVALRVLFSGTKGPSLNHENQSQIKSTLKERPHKNKNKTVYFHMKADF